MLIGKLFVFLPKNEINKNMKDIVLLKCKETSRSIKNPFDEKGDLNIDTVIKESDLTDLGKQLFDDLADKWFAYTDRTQKYDNITI